MQNSNVSCCALAVICAFSNFSKTNSGWYFRIKCKKTQNRIDNLFICVNFDGVDRQMSFTHNRNGLFPVKGQMIDRIAQF